MATAFDVKMAGGGAASKPAAANLLADQFPWLYGADAKNGALGGAATAAAGGTATQQNAAVATGSQDTSQANAKVGTPQAPSGGQVPYQDSSTSAGVTTPPVAAPAPAVSPAAQAKLDTSAAAAKPASVTPFAYTAPTYQTYQFTAPQPGQYVPPQMISAQSVASYAAPTATPQYAGADTSGLDALVSQLAKQLGVSAAPTDTAALDEQQKELLLSQRTQNLDSARMSAARNGTSAGGGILAGQEANANEAFTGDYTKAIRDIALQAKDADFAHQLAALSGVSSATAQKASTAENEFGTKLSGVTAGEGFKQAAASSGQGAANYGLNRDQLAAAIAKQSYDAQSDAAGLGLRAQEDQSGANNQTNQSNLASMLGVGNLNLGIANGASNQNDAFLQWIYKTFGGG